MKSEDVKSLGVVIIESLRGSDKKTGKILHEEALRYKQFKEPNLSNYYYEERTKASFIKRLDNIYKEVSKKGFFPFIHIEAHGYDNGIQLSSGEKITWRELMPYFTKINVALSNSLVISLGSCYGISIINSIDPTRRAPFFCSGWCYQRSLRGRCSKWFCSVL